MGDNKISHVESKVVDKVMEMTEEKIGKMPQTRGDEKFYVGMNKNSRKRR